MEFRRATTCSDCLGALRSVQKTSQWRCLAPLARTHTQRSLSSRSKPAASHRNAPASHRQWTRQYATATASSSSANPTSTNPSPSDLNAIHKRVQELASSVLRPQDSPVPSEQRILYVLEQLDSLAKSLVDAKSINAASRHAKHTDTATSALLGSVNNRQAPSSVTKATLLTLISQKAEEIVRHDNVFITPGVLKAYTELQTLLHPLASQMSSPSTPTSRSPPQPQTPSPTLLPRQRR
jgi:hypothetical protein